MESFKIYRRHEKDCLLFKEGAKSDIKKCTCPLWVDGTENGKRVRKSLKTRSVSRGLERLVRMQREPAVEKSKAVPIAEAVKLYLDDCRSRSLAANTLRSYQARLDPLVEFFDKEPVRSITGENLAEFRAAHPCGKAPASARSQILALYGFLKFCLGRKWTAENAAKSIKLPKASSKLTPPYTADEIDRMLQACDELRPEANRADHNNRERARALILVMLYSGLRISDAVKLKRADVDFENGKVLLRVMKTGAPLYTNLPVDALNALRLIVVRSPYFFWSGRGNLESAITNARGTIYAVGKHAKVAGARPHRFRDTFSVNLLANGVDIRTVQLLLGHASVVTTEKHYAPYVAGTQRLIDSAVRTLHFGSRAARVVDTLGNARRNANRDPRRPVPLLQESA